MRKYIIILTAALVTLASCRDDFRYDNMVNNSLIFPRAEFQTVEIPDASYNDFVYDIVVYKAGFFNDPAHGMVELDYGYIVEYNDLYGTDYEMLPEKYYKYQREFTIGTKDVDIIKPLYIDNTLIVADKGYGKYYIPFRLRSTTHNVDLNAKTSKMLLEVNIKQPKLTIIGDYKGEQSINIGASELITLDITSSIDFRALEDYTVTYTWSPRLLPEGKQLLDRQYFRFPGEVVIPTDRRSPADDTYLEIMSQSVPEGEWIIPVKLTINNPKIDTNEAYLVLTVNK